MVQEKATPWPGWLPKARRNQSVKGFTLAELLITLAILGEIATFTIPKVLSAQQDGRKRAVFKETISALSGIYYIGVLQGEITGSGFNYVTTKLNTVKICTSNSLTEGCTATAKQGGTETGRGVVLHNGAQLFFFSGALDDWIIDWNGDGAPNLYGDDIVHVLAAKSDFQQCGAPSPQIRAGQVKQLVDYCGWPEKAASNALYLWVFQ